MTFRQFADLWINDNVSMSAEKSVLTDIAEVFSYYEPYAQTMLGILNNFQKLVAAWKEYQEK